MVCCNQYCLSYGKTVAAKTDGDAEEEVRKTSLKKEVEVTLLHL